MGGKILPLEDEELTRLSKEYAKDICETLPFTGIAPQLDRNIAETCKSIEFLFVVNWLINKGY